MGEIYLDLTVANIENRERQKELAFFVDTGATRAWIPQTVADELGIEPAGRIAVELADGTRKEFPYGFCLLGYDGDTVAATVMIGPPEIEPLLGNLVLQDLRFVIDMERHMITRRGALKAKKQLDGAFCTPHSALRN